MADVDFLTEQDELNLNDVPLEGDITVPKSFESEEEDGMSTLDEPVKDTILRDLKAVGVKFFHVLYPKQSEMLLREWDLWGPLILCVLMALMLQSSPEDLDKKQVGGPEFSEVFVIFWAGSVIVTLNSKLLGGKISFFQSVCVLGYCVSPLALGLIICRLILMFSNQNVALFVVRFLVVCFAFGWSTFASTAFLATNQPYSKKYLAMYPIFLFYFVISWLIISHTWEFWTRTKNFSEEFLDCLPLYFMESNCSDKRTDVVVCNRHFCACKKTSADELWQFHIN